MPFPIILAETPNTTVGGMVTAGATVVVAIIGGFFVWLSKRRDSSFDEVMRLYNTVKAECETMRDRMAENDLKMDENNARVDGLEIELRTLKAKLRSAEELNALASLAAESHLARADKLEVEKAELKRQLADCIGRKGGQTRRSTDVLNGADKPTVTTQQGTNQ